MNRNVIVSCAVTGSGDSVAKHPGLPITPQQIAEAAIEAAQAGAAIAHIHVRDPDTGAASRRLDLYREVVARIRDSGTDVIINLTTGMGGDVYFGSGSDPLQLGAATDCISQRDRMEHIIDLRPEICTMDCGSFNYPNPDYVYVSTTGMLREGCQIAKDLGVKPELEIFDLGHMSFARQLISEGLLEGAPLLQICLGVKWGAEANTTVFKAMVDSLPSGCNWGGFGVGAMEMPMVAQAVLLGGNVRVGLEDNLYLDRGVLASNGQLVERACSIVTQMGCSIQSVDEARASLGLLTPG